ncbi:hypothetical protein Aperf_G00000026042 [Anoplocephala perfoliata]
MIYVTFGLEICNDSQITYENTPCDADGSHFIIKFPKDPTACFVNEGPKFVKTCTKTCEPGHFLSGETNNCELCPEGTAAPGYIYEINTWPSMPDKFYSDVLNNDASVNCSEFGWKPRNSYILGTASSTCGSELTLENKNIRPGDVTFQYKFTDSFALAYFTIRNERCVLSGGKSHILPPSSKDKWATFTTSVPAGASTIQWYLFSENYYDVNSVGTQFKLRSVRVTGRPATVNCPECEPGYYSDKAGLSRCKKCPVNTYSARGSSSCIPCKTEEFAIPGSGSCRTKESCKPTEYATSYTACDVTTDKERGCANFPAYKVLCEILKQLLIMKPIEPVICNSDQLPSLTVAEASCKPCPLGTRAVNSTHCETCGSGFLSTPEGQSCQSCPPDEVPIFGIKYNSWSRMPPRMSTYCIEADYGCQTWQLNGSSIFVGPELGSYVYSMLELDLGDGFLSSKPNGLYFLHRYSTPLPGTKLVVDFEVDCTGECSLSLLADMPLITVLIHKWTGRVKRTKFVYEPFECEGTTFVWEFIKRNPLDKAYDPEVRSDRAIIYSIEMNNTRETGAIGCKKCPLGIDGHFCKPCPNGRFYTMVKNETSGETHAECVPCPNGTMVVGDASAVMTVEQACKKCPPGMILGSNGECFTDLKPNITSGLSYDFRELFSTGFTTKGSKLFTSQGQEFQHHFKIFLDTNRPASRSTCIDDIETTPNVSAWICRETWSPLEESSSGKSYLRSRPISIGDRMVKALQTNSSAEFAKNINERLVSGGWKSDDIGTDYHLLFQTKSATSVCVDGISSIVTLRCGEIVDETSTQNGTNELAQLQIPPKCAVGTCDGCVFHFMVISPLACPVCRMDDYRRIEGGCHGGSMEVTLLPPKYCHPPQNFTTVLIQSCPWLSTQGKIAVSLTSAIVIMLILTIFYCYQRNKKLEYKYMKLVEGAEARVRDSIGKSESASKQQGTECGIPEDDKETESYSNQYVSAIAGGKNDQRWNQLTPSSSGDKGAGFGPVIFRTRTADDSHILTLDDGNEPV